MPSKGPPPPHPTFLRFLMTKAGKGGGECCLPFAPSWDQGRKFPFPWWFTHARTCVGHLPTRPL